MNFQKCLHNIQTQSICCTPDTGFLFPEDTSFLCITNTASLVTGFTGTEKQNKVERQKKQKAKQKKRKAKDKNTKQKTKTRKHKTKTTKNRNQKTKNTKLKTQNKKLKTEIKKQNK